MRIEVQKGVDERPISSSRRRQHELAERATRQHGVIARRQLLQLGYSSEQIKRMQASHALHPIHRGVYAVGHRTLTRRGRWMAAVLASGPGALLSHRCAAALRQVHRTSPSYVEVIVPCKRGRIAGVRAYISARLEPPDRDEIDGIPCTSLALTLLQLAAVSPRRHVERACDEAEVQEIFDLAAIDELLHRSRGRRGVGTLRAVLREHAIGTTLTRNDFEESMLAALDRLGVPRPQVNVRVVCGRGAAPEVDFLWRSHRLVLETDGNRFHSTRRQIERDRSKEADLVRAGYRVLRATWLQVEREPHEVALMVAAALAGYASSSA